MKAFTSVLLIACTYALQIDNLKDSAQTQQAMTKIAEVLPGAAAQIKETFAADRAAQKLAADEKKIE